MINVGDLYAACRPNGPLEVRHVQVTAQVAGQLDPIFQAQGAAFMSGVNAEIDFNGDWKPDDDEILVVRGLPEAQILINAVNQNAIALPVLDVANFDAEGVRALFTTDGAGPNLRILAQNFGPNQILSNRMSFLYDNNTFRRLTEPAFTLGTQLVATIDAQGDVRFKSYPMLRRILDVKPVFRAATDRELTTFCASPCLAIADRAGFIGDADEVIRKQVLAITKSQVLVDHTVDDLEAYANAIGFDLVVNGGRIQMPDERKARKNLLSFLLNRVYLGPINQQLFITNSTRPLA